MIKIFCPTYVVKSVFELDPHELAKKGYRGVIVDLDNTLVPWNQHECTPEIEKWWRRCSAAHLKGCIVSNNRLTEKVREFAGRLGVSLISNASKPRRGCFRRAMQEMGSVPEETVVVGDQIFTDVLGGNRLGMTTILVMPISHKEFIGTMVVRRFERILLSFFSRRGMLRKIV